MIYAFHAMFMAFILTAPAIPTWALAIPIAGVISQVTLDHRKARI